MSLFKTAGLCSLLLTTAVWAQQPSRPAQLGQAGQPGSQAAPYPQGILAPKVTLVSHVYEGMMSPYWVYTPAGYDSSKPAPLMVFQDGGSYLSRNGDLPMLNALDKLTAEHRIPVMVYVFTDAGEIDHAPGSPVFAQVSAFSKRTGRNLKDSMRSMEYDTVSDRYARFLEQELLPDVEKHYKLRHDAYSRAISGLSSGGIAAFNAAWQRPDMFSRVLCWIGSFTALQWREDPKVIEGGQDYPAKVRRETHRNLRVSLQDGAADLDNMAGNWPLANVGMANALKFGGYDFRFFFGVGGHSAREGFADFEGEMTWLWRGYDPSRTEELYVQDPSEKTKEPYKIGIVNR